MKLVFTESEITSIINIRETIQIASNIGKECRKPNTRDLIKNHYLILPILPNETRWEGIFQMLDYIIKINNTLKQKNLPPTIIKSSEALI